jgi:hypothetical protein
MPRNESGKFRNKPREYFYLAILALVSDGLSHKGLAAPDSQSANLLFEIAKALSQGVD